MIWIHISDTFSSKYGDRRIRRSRKWLTAGQSAGYTAESKTGNILIGQDLEEDAWLA